MSKSQFQIEYEEYQKYKEWQEMLGCKNAQEVIDFVMSNCLTEDEKCRAISDLEAKLAEKQSRIQELNDLYEKLLCAKGTENELMQVSADCDFFAKENRKLKQQLADKEKEIESLKAGSDKNIDYLIEFASLIENEKDCNKMLKALDRVKQGKKYIIDKERQDKISFAVEQLEKVKEKISDFEYEDIFYFDKFIEYINNQIKQLKEGK